MQAEIFLDSAYAIALAASNDRFHDRAVMLAEQMEAQQTRLVNANSISHQVP